jgi:hypothetical protein
VNATFIRQYRESKKVLENVNEPIKVGKRVNLTSENTNALERLKSELGNVESQLEEFEIVDQVNESQDQKPKEETLDSLFTSESGNRNIEFYDILYKRYAKEIKQGIEDNFTETLEDGTKEILSNDKRMEEFVDIIEQVDGVPYTKSEIGKLIIDGKILQSIIDGVPTITFNKTLESKFEIGGQKVYDTNSGKLFGIMLIENNDSDEDFTNLEYDKMNKKHEFVHVANQFLIPKLNIYEQNPIKKEILESFIDEFLAYGTNMHLARQLFSAEEICESMLYCDFDGSTGEGKKNLEIAGEWKKAIDKSIIDSSGLYRNKIKAYLIKHAKNFDTQISKPQFLTN